VLCRPPLLREVCLRECERVRGDLWDNAVAESFFASLEKELLRRERFATREQARLRIFWYIECFYNPRRRHSSLGMLSPIDYEQRDQQEAIAA
jgi:putative transposase